MKELDRSLVTCLFPYYFASTKKQYNEIMKQFDNPERGSPITPGMGACCCHFLHDDGAEYAVVYMPLDHDVTKIEAFAMLAHEATHLWQHVKISLSEKKPSGEFEAYAMQHICQNLFAAYDKAMKKRSKKNAK